MAKYLTQGLYLEMLVKIDCQVQSDTKKMTGLIEQCLLVSFTMCAITY